MSTLSVISSSTMDGSMPVSASTRPTSSTSRWWPSWRPDRLTASTSGASSGIDACQRCTCRQAWSSTHDPIGPIGSWVLDQSCRQIQRWQASIPDLAPLVLAVNLSGRQLGHHRLVDDVARVLADTGIDPSMVELEITESVLMDDVEMSEETLGRLKRLGVKLVVDDFGTGYSSLSYLRRFPVDVLKVDQSFVDGLGSDSGDSAIVTAVVTLAHTLGLRAVAEGVETREQLSELRRLGCNTAAGFLLRQTRLGSRHRRSAATRRTLVTRQIIQTAG